MDFVLSSPKYTLSLLSTNQSIKVENLDFDVPLLFHILMLKDQTSIIDI